MKHLLRHAGVVLVFFVITAATAVALVRVFAPNDACTGNAKLLYQAIVRYEQDHYGNLPPTQSVTAFQTAVKPYVTDTKLFICPATGKAYIPNPNPVGEPDKTYLFMDSAPHSDGYPTIVYLDGHVERNGVEPGDTNMICASRVKQLTIGVLQYVQDYDEIFPKMATPQELKVAISPYVQNSRPFTCPATNTEYLPNPGLSYKSVAQIEDQSSTFAIMDAQAHKDGIKTTGYLDGHVNRIKITDQPTCLNNLRELDNAVFQYSFDHNDTFPIMTDRKVLKSEILPYTSNVDLLNCPETRIPYEWNVSLSGISLATIENPSGIELIRDAAPHKDGAILKLYADGHIKSYLSPYFVPHQIATATMDNSDIMYMLWKKPGGTSQIWALDGFGSPLRYNLLNPSIPTVDKIIVDPYQTLWSYTQSNNCATVWRQDTGGNVQHVDYGPYDGWAAAGLGIGNNRVIRMLWTRYDNTAAVWFATADGRYQWDQRIPAPTGMKAIGFNVCPDGRCIILWSNSTGGMVISKMESSGAAYNSHAYAFTGWKPVAITSDTTNRSYILWSDNNGNANVWAMYSNWTYKQTTYSIAPGWTAVSLAVGSDSNRRIVWHNDDGRTRLVVYNQRGAQISAHDYPAMR